MRARPNYIISQTQKQTIQLYICQSNLSSGATADETTLSAYTASALISPQTKARPFNPSDPNNTCISDHKFNCQTNPICLADGFYKSSVAGGFERGCVQNQAMPGTTLPASLAYIGLKSGAC